MRLAEHFGTLSRLVILALLGLALIWGCTSESGTVNSGDGAGDTLGLGDTTGDTIPGDTVPGDTTPGDTVPDDTIPGDTLPDDTIPGDTIPGDTVPDDTVPGDTVVADLDLMLQSSPVSIDSIESIVALGNLNPPGHTLPTDHGYLYLMRPVGEDTPYEITLYSPARLLITKAIASEHVVAGFKDYSIVMALGDHARLEFGHVTSLDSSVFGDVSTFDDWQLLNEYSTGGETYRMWEKEYSVVAEDGQLLGTAGGNAGQYALDIGVYDDSYSGGTPVDPASWQYSRALIAGCPFDYYESGPVLDSLRNLFVRADQTGDPYPCGWVIQDVAGSAQGAWFKPGEPTPYPEDPHIALVWDPLTPDVQAFSVGSSVSTLPSGVYRFIPGDAGHTNRRFDQVPADSSIYGYLVGGSGVGGPEWTILIRMADSLHLEIEGFTGHITDSTSWQLTGAEARFVR